MQSIENAINIIIQILYYPQFPSKQLPVTCPFTSRYSFIFPLHLFYLMTCQWDNPLISNSVSKRQIIAKTTICTQW